MADINVQRNVGALGDLLRLSDQASATAGGSGNATTVTGYTIDRMKIGASGSTGSMPLSALVAVLFGTTLQSGKTLSVSFDVQDSPDGTNFSDYQTAASAVVATGPSGGGAVTGQAELQVSLTSARRYVRLLFVPTLSATGTDTATVIGAAFVAGFDRLAAPQG